MMAKQKEEKTNVMRTLEQKKVPYTPHTSPHSTKPYAGYGVMSSKRLPYGSQNSAYSLWEYASNRKHCLRLARGEKSGHFSTPKNGPGLCLQGNFP